MSMPPPSPHAHRGSWRTDDPRAQFQLLEELGRGSFAVVHSACERATGELVAIKVVVLAGASKDELESLHAEVSLLASLRDTSIVSFRGAWCWSGGDGDAAAPPKFFAHVIPPPELSLSANASLDPISVRAGFGVVRLPFLNVPPTKTLPELSTATVSSRTLVPLPPYVFAQTTVPPALYLTTNPSWTPIRVSVVPTTWRVGPL